MAHLYVKMEGFLKQLYISEYKYYSDTTEVPVKCFIFYDQVDNEAQLNCENLWLKISMNY